MIVAASDGALVIRALVIGFVPAIWGMSLVRERLAGRNLWDFTAPYPYRWMSQRETPLLPRPNDVSNPVEDTLEANDRSTLPRAA
jgi:hypothetical protein